MRTTVLGSNGLTVSAVGLGCMGMSEFYGPVDPQASLRTLEQAVELGLTFLDTSDAYGIGANERLLGEFLARTQRDRVVIATKFGAVRDPETGRPVGVRGDAAYVREACDASLRRLGTDHIDLYYQHVPDPRVPITETVGAMAELVASGKVRHLGLSNITAEQLRAAHGVHPIAAVQNEWSLFTREAERDLVPACAELGTGFVPYSPLGRGFLTGAYTSTENLSPGDFRHAVPRFSGSNAEHNRSLLDQVQRVAAAHAATTGQIALAWLLRQQATRGLSISPIPGTANPTHLRENAAAADIQLTDEELAVLDPIAAGVAGDGRPPTPAAVSR